MRRAFGDHGAMVPDASGAVVVASWDRTARSARRWRGRAAIDSGEVQYARRPHRRPRHRRSGSTWWRRWSAQACQRIAAIVLRIDPQTFLLPTLEAAPTGKRRRAPCSCTPTATG